MATCSLSLKELPRLKRSILPKSRSPVPTLIADFRERVPAPGAQYTLRVVPSAVHSDCNDRSSHSEEASSTDFHLTPSYAVCPLFATAV